MAAYQKSLIASGHRVRYIGHEPSESMDYLFHPLKAAGITVLHVVDPIDSLLEKRLHENSAKSKIALHVDPSPAFLTDRAWFKDLFGRLGHYSMTSFYIAQRKRLGVMLNKGKPEGGRWTFDTENDAIACVYFNSAAVIRIQHICEGCKNI